MELSSGTCVRRKSGKIEKIQRRAARFISGDYWSINPVNIQRMLPDLNLQTLQDRRKEQRLAFPFKMVEGIMPELPPSQHLIKITNKRRIRTYVRLEGYLNDNPVGKWQLNNSKCLEPISATTLVYKTSLVARSVPECNRYEESITKHEAFKSNYLIQRVFHL